MTRSRSKKPSKKSEWKTATRELQRSVGIFDFESSNSSDALSPAQWIAKVRGIRKSIHGNIRFLLGNGKSVGDIKKAVNEIYDRDYPKNEGRKQLKFCKNYNF